MNSEVDSIPLRDIHLPDAVTWWPLAPGWWVLMLVCLLALALPFYILTRKKRRQLTLAALTELQALKTAYAQHDDKKRSVMDLSALLRRICISRYPLREVAGLTGEKWLVFLDHCLVNTQHSGRHSFQKGAGRPLIRSPYTQPANDPYIDMDSLFSLCEQWIQALPTKKDAVPKSRMAAVKTGNPV